MRVAARNTEIIVDTHAVELVGGGGDGENVKHIVRWKRTPLVGPLDQRQ